jgi:protein O-mannosyl-transferase
MLDKINIGSQKQILIVCIILTLVTLAVFWRVNQCDFISIDDPVYVTRNIHIQSGITLDGIRWAFTTTYAEFWHPLTWLSLMLDNQLYGLNAGGYHLNNLILHVFSALLLFLLFKRMTGAIWRSSFVAALFAIHPLHVQSVAWIAERKDVLSAFFWMLTLYLYVYYTEKPVIKRYLLVVFGFVCALMSKSMVVTLPLVMILLDYWPLKRFDSHKGNLILWQLKEKVPLFIFSAIFSIITLYAQSYLYVEHSLSSRLASAPISFVVHLEKIFCPHDLAFVYPFPNQLSVWQVMGAVLLIAFISTSVILAVKRLPYLFVGWLWYVITILPVIGIIPVGDPMADRYIYLPSIGISIIVVWGVLSLMKSEEVRRKILFPAGIAVLAILSFLTWQQCTYWRTGIELFSHAIQVTKDNYLAYNNLGVALFDEGKIEEAVNQYNKGISIKSNALILDNRGSAYGKLGRYDLAIEDFNKAIGLDPGDQTAHYNRGSAYGKLGQYQQAIKDFNMAILLKPDYAEAYYNRGITYILQGNNKNGCLDAQKVCTLGNCRLLEFAKVRNLCR